MVNLRNGALKEGGYQRYIKIEHQRACLVSDMPSELTSNEPKSTIALEIHIGGKKNEL